jgi:hypothetical protein
MTKIIKIDKMNKIITTNKTIKYSISELLETYNSLLVEYNKLFNKISNITFNHFNYFIGINTITNIFHMTLIKTRNLNLTTFHTQKAIYYFIEFIEQISDINNQFLKLTIKEAVIFVYKKTIFELTSPSNTLSKYSTSKITILKEITNIYKLLISHYINLDIDETSIHKYLTTIIDKTIKLFNLKTKIKYTIFYKNLNTLYYTLVTYIPTHSFEETITYIDNHITTFKIMNTTHHND